MVLTAARPSEALEARWAEVDFDRRLWTLPPERMKSAKQHVVPLSSAALAVLDRQQRVRTGDAVFPGRSGAPVSYAGFATAPAKVGIDGGLAAIERLFVGFPSLGLWLSLCDQSATVDDGAQSSHHAIERNWKSQHGFDRNGFGVSKRPRRRYDREPLPNLDRDFHSVEGNCRAFPFHKRDNAVAQRADRVPQR
jgi:Phage integrase family